jgi:hypothetical protein
MQAELIEQRDALMKLRRPASRSLAFFHDLVLKRRHVGCWGNDRENVQVCRTSMSGLFEATGGRISGVPAWIFVRGLGACAR